MVRWVAFLSESLSDDLVDLVCTRVHRLNFAAVLAEVRSYPSPFERALCLSATSVGDDPIARFRRSHEDVRLFEASSAAGSSKLLMWGSILQRFVFVSCVCDSFQHYDSSETIYEGVLEGDKVSIERAHKTCRYRGRPDTTFDSVRDLVAASELAGTHGCAVHCESGTDPGIHWSVGPLRSAVDKTYESGKTWQEFPLLWRWFFGRQGVRPCATGCGLDAKM